MKQTYHSNAVTNVHIRGQFNLSNLTSSELAQRFNISINTVRKWKGRENLFDKSSRPNRIRHSLDYIEKQIVVSVRKTTWLPLDEVWEMMMDINPEISRSAVYRTLKSEGLNLKPQEVREKAKKFKEYDPGFLHIDVTYLPKFNGVKQYLFVAIDRATRTLFFEVYDAKTSSNAENFMKKCLDYFPFEITHVLTDNGLEFTNRLIRSKKGALCVKPSKLDVLCSHNNIEHRHTRPFTPKTNGMVERVNGTIKNGTILKEKYRDLEHLQCSLTSFMIHYMLYRRHAGVRKELKVKTPFQAIEKWYQLKPEIFKQNPTEFKNKLLSLKIINDTSIQ
jgi:transposase-like protein